MPFGIKMCGNEISFESYLNQAIQNHIALNVESQFIYLEIGAAACETLITVRNLLLTSPSLREREFHAYGLDLPNGWSLDWKKINSVVGLSIEGSTNGQDKRPNGSRATLLLEKNPREMVKRWDIKFPNAKIDFCFIDGCHGKACAVADFLAVEPHIRTGGIVCFHDVGVVEQGQDFQEHCGEYINVRQGIIELGLFDNARAGWKFLSESVANYDNNNCGFFQKL